MKSFFRLLLLQLCTLSPSLSHAADIDYEKLFYEISNARPSDLERGNSTDHYRLGMMYAHGTDLVPQDSKEAVRWLTKAAQEGHSKAQARLGVLYIEGKDVPQDYDKALHWIVRSAIQEDVLGQTLLGKMYADGVGVTKNLSSARQMYVQAIGQTFVTQDLLNEIRGVENESSQK